MTETIWIVVIVNTLGVLAIWIKAYYDYKARKSAVKKINGGSNPSTAYHLMVDNYKQINDNRLKLVELDTKIRNIEGDILEIKDDIKGIKRG
uniref:Uncharacterized protein n=1 Tax=viral metagenome TaxID=1070528 RepID=A0A6M3MGC3_9ZZZZ